MCCLMIMMPGNAVLFLHSARGTWAAALSFGQKGPRITVFRVLDVSLSASRSAFRPDAKPNCWMTGRMTVTAHPLAFALHVSVNSSSRVEGLLVRAVLPLSFEGSR